MYIQNYKAYKNIMSTNPVFDKDYLSSILHLSESQIIDVIEVTEIIESTTALVIKVNIQINDSGTLYTRKLFIKTIKHNTSENVYHHMSMQEGKFYQMVKDHTIHNLPIPLCYDVFVSDEKNEFVIVLEDISNRYAVPDSTVLTDKNIWFSCAESLAKFHSAFWNHNVISHDKAEHDAVSDRECLQSFLHDFRDEFDSVTKTTLERAMEINISLIKETSRRKREKNNVTICNGDSHIYNFMLSPERNKNSLMVDFQFWGGGISTDDLAHLTRVSFSDELKEDIQIPLVEHYHKTLLAHGVTGYTWENCLSDYRTSVASMVLIPLWQYSGFGLKYDEWIGALRGLIYNYEYMKCDEHCRIV